MFLRLNDIDTDALSCDRSRRPRSDACASRLTGPHGSDILRAFWRLKFPGAIMVRGISALLTIVTLVMHALVGCCPGHRKDVCIDGVCVGEHQSLSNCRHSHSAEKCRDAKGGLSEGRKDQQKQQPCRHGGSCPLGRCEFVPVVRVSVPSLCGEFGFAVTPSDGLPTDVCSRLCHSEWRNRSALMLLDVHPRREMTGVWLI